MALRQERISAVHQLSFAQPRKRVRLGLHHLVSPLQQDNSCVNHLAWAPHSRKVSLALRAHGARGSWGGTHQEGERQAGMCSCHDWWQLLSFCSTTASSLLVTCHDRCWSYCLAGVTCSVAPVKAKGWYGTWKRWAFLTSVPLVQSSEHPDCTFEAQRPFCDTYLLAVFMPSLMSMTKSSESNNIVRSNSITRSEIFSRVLCDTWSLKALWCWHLWGVCVQDGGGVCCSTTRRILIHVPAGGSKASCVLAWFGFAWSLGLCSLSSLSCLPLFHHLDMHTVDRALSDSIPATTLGFGGLRREQKGESGRTVWEEECSGRPSIPKHCCGACRSHFLFSRSVKYSGRATYLSMLPLECPPK